MAKLIAVTGSTGGLGGEVARQLAAGGHRQRLVVRDAGRAPRLAGAEVATASYDDRHPMVKALTGADTLFFVSGHEGPDRVAQHTSLIDAAAEAGVRRIVYTSFLGAAPHATFSFARDHAATEQAVIAAGIELTSLRHSLYAEAACAFVGADGIMRGPAGVGRIAWLPRYDAARLATTVLTEQGHEGQIYDVSGPEAISLADTATILL